MAEDGIQAENTATRRRNGIPRPVKKLRNLLLKPGEKVLDFGCGWGESGRYLREQGFDVTDYDVAAKFGVSVRPTQLFDVVMAVYVLNVLGPEQRVAALRDAWGFVKPGGELVLVTRTWDEIETEAKGKGWEPHLDGYFSDRRNGKFQKGLDYGDLERLVRSLNNVAEVSNPFPRENSFSSLVAVNRATL
jgi:SAM-dependent methyltransferase